MKIKVIIWIALILGTFHTVDMIRTGFQNEYIYDYDFDPGVEDGINLNTIHKTNNLPYSGLPHSTVIVTTESPTQDQTTTCKPSPELPPQENFTTPSEEEELITTVNAPHDDMDNCIQGVKSSELKKLVQLLYIAQARVQLEASEIKKAQAIANSAQQSLEEAANHVRSVITSLQNSHQEVASAAIRAQTAQLQLAAHDQLLFAARQDVDTLSSQMVALQAVEGISEPKLTVDLEGLLKKLQQPLQEYEKPTQVPTIIQIP